MEKKVSLALMAAALLGAMALAVITFLNPSLRPYCFAHFSYSLIFLLVFLWVVTLVRTLRKQAFDFKGFFQNHWGGAACAFALTAFIFLSVPPFFRVLSDELELLAISRSMAFEGRVDIATTGIYFDYHFQPFHYLVSRRPLLFPFFTHLLHIFMGFRTFHPFVLNFITLFALLFFIFVLIKENLGPIWAYSSLFFVAAQPIVTQTATSGGFDLFALLFLILNFMCLQAFLKSPSTAAFQLLWIHLLMLANIRYESLLFCSVILLFLAALRYLKKEYFQPSFLYALTPALLLPQFWQRLLDTRVAADPASHYLFQASTFLEHARGFANHLISFDRLPPTAPFLNILGIAGVVYFMFLFISKRWPQENFKRHLFLIASLCVLVQWGLLMPFYYGDVTAPCCNRLFALFFVLFSLFSILLLERFRLFENKKPLIIILAVFIFAAHHALTLEDRFSNGLTMTLRERRILNFLKTQEQRDVMIVTDQPVHYTARNYGAVDFSTAASMSETLAKLMEQHFLQNIFVIQKINVKTLTPSSETSLGPQFPLQILRNYHYDNDYFIRISRVQYEDLKGQISNRASVNSFSQDNGKPVIKPNLYAI